MSKRRSFQLLRTRAAFACAALACSAVAWSCQVDDRSLSLSALSDAGAKSGGAGGNAAGSSSVQSRGGAAGSTIDSQAGSAGEAGAESGPGGAAGSGEDAGAAGELATGGSSSGGTSGSTGAAGGGAAGSESGGSGGVAGSSAPGPCGDLDQNGVDDCSETLVLNSRFSLDVDHWTAEVYDTIVWDTRNAEPSASSGALLVSNLAPVADAPGAFMAGAHQCLVVTPGASYVAAAQTMILGADEAAQAGINVQIFDGGDCTGTFLGAETVSVTSDLGAWRVVQGEVKMPAAAHSIWLRLVASKPFASTELDALFDDVLVRPK